MKPINEYTLQDCLNSILKADMILHRHELADRIHELTRWIPVEERLPTEGDGDRYGLVLKWDSLTKSAQIDSWNHSGTYNACYTHWRRIDKPEGV
jgi:hypothetical protein